MEKRQSYPFRRVLAVLLCVAMLVSYVVLPGNASDGMDETTSTDSSIEKVKMTIPNAHYYVAD